MRTKEEILALGVETRASWEEARRVWLSIPKLRRFGAPVLPGMSTSPPEETYEEVNLLDEYDHGNLLSDIIAFVLERTPHRAEDILDLKKIFESTRVTAVPYHDDACLKIETVRKVHTEDYEKRLAEYETRMEKVQEGISLFLSETNSYIERLAQEDESKERREYERLKAKYESPST